VNAQGKAFHEGREFGPLDLNAGDRFLLGDDPAPRSNQVVGGDSIGLRSPTAADQHHHQNPGGESLREFHFAIMRRSQKTDKPDKCLVVVIKVA
jgi:hypothetical protein